jgi:hypothetical protein
MPVKQIKKAAKPKFKRLPDLTLGNMQLYHKLTNWQELWKEFYLSINSDGQPKYRTVKQFAIAKKESAVQLQFLCWFLGPEIEGDDRSAKYTFAGKPLNWWHKRETGGWHTEAALKLISKNVRLGTNALQQMQEAGNDSALHQIYRVEKLKQQLDEDFRGHLLMDGISIKENTERMHLYLAGHAKLDALARSAFEQFALSRGINLADVSGYAQLMQGLNISVSNNFSSGAGTPEKTEVEKAIAEMIKMTMAKSKLFDLPVPADLQTIDVKPEEQKALVPKKIKPN